ncbi:hypothetical protein BHECKSOX_875 [Bathymodiolus heckerae thiotrophic gill symbiont]|uniref:glutaredoxin family protein n=1 Tax=Bathymodiolus heckerae thiotrophic gill symbiont TaxID=1052212 RepID=UPI0010B33322|nr:glutaredoxin family protein [Bathymodiolus heckerae thiotrophic gill symbiont]SHN92474.1 hypothetical protein BHECKSOX_875 [Bathymodiolus heckerae thiotrophic gill symbiont]
MDIVVYSTNTCPICVKTKELLDKWNLPFEQKMIDEDRAVMAEFTISHLLMHPKEVLLGYKFPPFQIPYASTLMKITTYIHYNNLYE